MAKKPVTKKTTTKPAGKPATVKAGKPKITAEQFAINQLKKAGIKPVGGDVKAQFRKLNKAAAAKRAKNKLGTAASVGSYSALAAGNRKAKPKKRGGGSSSSKAL